MFYDMGAVSTTATIVGKSIKVHCVYICVVRLNSNGVSKCMYVWTYKSFVCSACMCTVCVDVYMLLFYVQMCVCVVCTCVVCVCLFVCSCVWLYVHLYAVVHAHLCWCGLCCLTLDQVRISDTHINVTLYMLYLAWLWNGYKCMSTVV